MITTENPEWAATLRRLREHGMNLSAADRHASGNKVLIERYLEVGYNYRMTDVQASIGLVQLQKLAGMVDRRRAIVAEYRKGLADIRGVTPVAEPLGARSNYQSFWVGLDPEWPMTRNATLQFLADRGVQARRGIMAIHLEPAYGAFSELNLPATSEIASNSLILPVYHSMTAADINRVIQVIDEASEHQG